MSMAICSSSSDIRLSFCGNNRIRNLDLFGPKSFVRVAKSKEKGNANIYNYDLRNSVISGHLVPQQLEGSLMRNTRLSEPAPKLKLIRTLLIDNYDSYTYNIYQELSVINGLPPVVIRNDEWTWKDFYHYLYEAKAFDNIVISPGPGSPTCPEDIGICLRLLRECVDIPILGVCLGHQALGLAHGAQVVHASEPVHGRLSDLEHNGCRLFDDIPSGNSEFKVVRYHSLVLDPESLPEELIPIAWTSSSDTLPFLVANGSVFSSEAFDRAEKTSSDPRLTNMTNGKGCSLVHSVEMSTENVVMGVMHCTRPHYGLQFHPESVATHYGRKIFTNFREITKDYWSGLRSSPISERSDHYGGKLLKSCMQVSDIGGMLQCSGRLQHPMHRMEKENHVDFHDVTNLTQPCEVVKSLKLKWKKLELMASQVGGTGSIFQELFGNNKADNTFWLDSASTEKGRARFSFMGGKGSSLWKQVTFRLSDQSDKSCEGGGYLSIRDSVGNCQNTFIADGFFEYLNQDLKSFSYDPKDYEGLPFDFCGGYVGYIGYELKIECGMPLNHHKSRAPDACFFFADNLIVIDHHTADIYLLAIHDDGTDSIPWFDVVEQKLLNLTSSPMETSFSQVSQHSANSQWRSAFVAEKTKEQYTNDISKCQNFIKDGESYELCFTSQMRKDVEDIDPSKLYLLLREKNPAPYAAWLNFSEENLCVCCSSPERFLRLDKDGILEAKPIKGTIARGATLEEDELLKLQLQYSEKDQAENLMIVDLLRNDLGRVCEPGSVHVPHLMEVESYATVHTMVSTIRGNKRSDVSPVDCVKAAFPGGSMTGAPKLRSMELLDTLESSARGIYSGCIGFFSYNQTFDLNIVIRTVVIHEGEASIGAGGAITALSNSHDEYEEMILKTRAPANAVVECERDSK